MSRGRGRGRGDGARREMSALQTELIGKSIFRKNQDSADGFPDYEVNVSKQPTEEEKHIAHLLEQLQTGLKSSVFYLQKPAPPNEIERYSDRYFSSEQGEANGPKSLKGLKTNPELFPEELHPSILKKKAKKSRAAADVKNGLLEALEGAKDDDDGDDDDNEGSGEKKGEDDEEGAEEEIEEEDEEEENDYMDTYFDNGEAEDFGEIDDDDGGGDYY
ncbi:hypothetical protein GGI12_004353 [Dipsacomyces acuminosporus]|nr:hypothetical protein GGI12_004353 [Dipsacomyces acuminosporus]